MSAINITVFYAASDRSLLIASMCLFGLYLFPLILAKPLMRAHGYRYARVLVQEDLALDARTSAKHAR